MAETEEMVSLPTPALTGLVALLSQGAPAPEAPAAEVPHAGATLIHGGRIYTNDPKHTTVDALLVQDGRVVALGSESELLERAGSDEWARLDLAGGTAVPGLQDAHVRLERLGERLESLDLGGCQSEAELVERAAAAAATLEDDAWLIGHGWDAAGWPDGLPHHAELSEAVSDRPALLWSADGRAALANRRALELAELDGRLDPPPRLQGGMILRDEKRYATGVLVDSAIERVLEHAPQPTREDRERWILKAQEELLSLGLTCVHDMDVSFEAIKILRELRESGELRLRVVAYLGGNERLSADMLEGLPEFDVADRLSIVGVSLRLDGTLAWRGAALLEDYSDAPGERGHTLLTKEDLARRVALITGARLQPAVQAVGNDANRMVLDVYQELGGFIDGFARLRPRVEHAQIVAPRDWPRFPALGVIPSVQPLPTAQSRAWLEERLGADRTRDGDAWRRLAPELGRLAFGSSAPAAAANPLLGLRAVRMRDRTTEDEDGFLPYDQLDGEAALIGFTTGPAYACHQEERRGRLSVGYAADLSVFDLDPVTCSPDQLPMAEVRMSVIDGRVVFRAGP